MRWASGIQIHCSEGLQILSNKLKVIEERLNNIDEAIVSALQYVPVQHLCRMKEEKTIF